VDTLTQELELPANQLLALFNRSMRKLAGNRIIVQCCGSVIRCLFDPWIRDPGWKNQDLGSEMKIPDHIFESYTQIFALKIPILWCGLRIRIRDIFDPDPGSGMEKFASGTNLDKHPVSEKLLYLGYGNQCRRMEFLIAKVTPN
jgi:hypothetical protein